jgi:hypothetical protein
VTICLRPPCFFEVTNVGCRIRCHGETTM